MRTLVRCTNCATWGKTRNLAEILPDGALKIIRMRSSEKIEFTILYTKEVTLMCGECGHLMNINIERRLDEGVSIGSQRVSWFSFMQGSLIPQMGSYQIAQGTSLNV